MIVDALIFYAESKADTANAPERIGYAVDKLLAWWRDRPVSAINGATCRAYAAEREASDGTIRRELGALKAAVRLYHAEGYITAAPAITMPPRPEGRDRWLTRNEAARLIAAAGQIERSKDYLPLFVRLGLETGTRHSAALALQWMPNTTSGWIDLERGMLYRIGIGQAQTTKRKPPAPIPSTLMPHLEKAREATRSHVMEYAGRPILSVKKSFARACRIAELGRDVVPHTLRHTCATWLALDGVPIYKAAQYLGVSAAEFDQTYGHYHPDAMKDVTNSIERR